MGAGLVISLVSSLLGAFAPQAQAKLAPIVNALGPIIPGGAAPITPATGTAPVSQDALLQFVQSIMQTALQVSGHANPAAATDADKIAATAKVMADPALVQQVQDNAVDHFAKIAPYIDKLATIEQAEWAANEASMDRAAARAASTFDMTAPLLYWALGAATLIVVALMAMAGIYAWNKQALPEMLLTLIVQTVTGILGFVALLFAFRFGSSRSSGAKDELVAQLATARKK